MAIKATRGWVSKGPAGRAMGAERCPQCLGQPPRAGWGRKEERGCRSTVPVPGDASLPRGTSAHRTAPEAHLPLPGPAHSPEPGGTNS